MSHFLIKLRCGAYNTLALPCDVRLCYMVNAVFTRFDIVTADNNCTWSDWSEWSNCSQQCDVSRRTRTRQCLTPPCTEDAEEIENCLRENCDGK